MRCNSPNRLEISELCILGLSCAIFLRCIRDHTMKAFMGRLMCSSLPFSFLVEEEAPPGEHPEAVESAGEGVDTGVTRAA